ncbi:hypothetical protein GM661_03380 [Iocasia frigidifontis]|uniref:Uncharacterized protein n=1 Tax=Iocasia fonsfrigidae TaxID=2682810 RepID=A0A8A7K5V0_9FIRM|nr:hypothetical protein [Iocasia fonsfrigidae]QTL97086.1 hypothetical protein GM661_03380 [Iocasia fonsfrigidae]
MFFKNDNSYIPGDDELEEESGHTIDVRKERNLRSGRVDFPSVEDEYTTTNFKADLAQQAGRFSDQVLMDSPAAEAGTTGKGNLKDIIKASDKKLSKKLNN